VSFLVKGALWIAVFAAVAIAPLVFAAIGVAETDRGFATEFSTALGFVGLTLMGLEFALVARFRAVIGVHVAISAEWDTVVAVIITAVTAVTYVPITTSARCGSRHCGRSWPRASSVSWYGSVS